MAIESDMKNESATETRAESPESLSPEEAVLPSAFQIKALLSGPFDLGTLSSIGLFLIAFFVVLSYARSLFLPIVVAGLLTFLFDPVVRWLHRLKLPRSVAAALVLLTVLGLLSFGVHRFLKPTRAWLEDAPRSMQRVERKLTRLMKPVEEVNEAAREVERLTKIPAGGQSQTVEVRNNPSLGESIYDGPLDLLVSTGVTLILTYFLLASGDFFLQKLVRMLPRLSDQKKVVGIARQIQRDVSTHLFTISLINGGLGICVGFMAWLFGLPNPVIWGGMAALLNFVPYIGALGGIFVLFGASLLHFDEPLHALLPPIAYLLLTTTEGSLITPMVLGHRLALNPVVIFLGLFFWGFIWGVPGALLAVPLLISFKIVCDHLEPLEPIGVLLGR